MPQDLKDYIPDLDTVRQVSDRDRAEDAHHRALEDAKTPGKKAARAHIDNEPPPAAVPAARPARSFWTKGRVSAAAALCVVGVLAMGIWGGRNLKDRGTGSGAATVSAPAASVTATVSATPTVNAATASAATASAGPEIDASAPGAAVTSATSATPAVSAVAPAVKSAEPKATPKPSAAPKPGGAPSSGPTVSPAVPLKPATTSTEPLLNE